MIIITGANGTLGRAITERLLDRLPAEQVAVSVRNPEQAADLQERGVRVRHGDFADPATLADAFQDATQVLIVSAGALGESAVTMNLAAISAATAAGAERILYTSHMGASPASLFPPMPTHARSEAALQESGVRFTALRNGFYTSTILRLLGDAARTGDLVLPQDGPVSWTAHADLADAAVTALTQHQLPEQVPTGQRLDGVTPALTATEALDMTAVAAIVSEITGRSVRRRVVPDEEYRSSLLAHGAPPPAADLLLGMFRASRQGEFATVDPTLPELLGHRPTSVRDVLQGALTPQETRD